MSRRKIAVVAGTRPEFIKLAPVLLALRARPGFDVRLIVTAQHREMLDQAAEAFGVEPDVDLNLMEPDQTPAALTTRVLTGLQRVLEQDRPDAVLVQGDTTTCFASAVAAYYEAVPVGHVEAGLRTHDLEAPWPEEMNRRLTDPLCQWCFAPTELAAANLRAERIGDDRIFVTGNTVVDALEMALVRIRQARPELPVPASALNGKRIIVVTGHRRESFGEPLRQLCLALRDLTRRFPDVAIVYPVHLNPNVAGPVHELLGADDRIHLLPPLAYLPFVSLLDRSVLIVTDSGGIQEEAPTLGKPVVVTRAATERPEAVALGLAALVGLSRHAIVEEVARLLERPPGASSAAGPNPYGDGQASERIAEILSRALS